jgi:hypothetical protein
MRRTFRPHLEALEDRTLLSAIVVTTTADDPTTPIVGQTTLRDAVNQANAAPGSTIEFNLSTSDSGYKNGVWTITLGNSALPTINQNVTIEGLGASTLAVSGNNQSGIFAINSGTQVSISGLTIEDGNAGSGSGGGINNSGALTVSNCTITSNSAGGGGGIFNIHGTLTVSNSTLADNSSTGQGGGIFSFGTLTVSNSTLADNSAGYGGGILADGGGPLTLINSTVVGNSAYNGGGIINDDTPSTVSNSTFADNSARNFGGGIFDSNGSSGSLSVSNSTFADNSATYGGGIYSFDPLTMSNTIVANSSAGGDLYGSTFSGAYNLIGDGSDLSSFTHSLQGNPHLASLGYYGGPTQTMALLPGSAALGVGDPSQNGKTDQRGFVRGSSVDIGAFQTQAAPLQVNTGDDTATGAELAGNLSLRDAINLVNVLSPAGGANTITFAIPTSDAGYNPSSGIWTITPVAALPTITAPAIIDGTSQPGFASQPVIVLSGLNAGSTSSGLVLTGGNSTVKGLVINQFGGDGIDLTTNGGDVIQGDYIGTNATGTSAAGNSNYGVFVSSANNTIGGTTAAARNVISGNTWSGVYIIGSGTTGNVVEGNYIGTNAAGSAALKNGNLGVWLDQGASNNVIGGTASGAGNVISGNNYQGVGIFGAGTNSNVIASNYIGTDASGNTALGNGNNGMWINNGPQSNLIENNVLSANTYSGIALGDEAHAGTANNVIAGNLIGTNASGTAALGNSEFGIYLYGGTGNVIGGTTVAARNVISGNALSGVYVIGSGTAGNFVEGNYIGTNAAGSAALGNVSYGVSLQSASVNSILNNTISGNSSDGVNITGNGALPGTVSWWKADGNANDAVGSNNATLQGGVTFAPGVTGQAGDQAFSLNGSGAFVNVPDSSSLDFGTGDFSVNVWVNFNSTSNEQVIAEKYIETSSPSSVGWTFTKLSTNALRLALADGGVDPVVNVDSPVLTIPTGTWINFTVTRQSNTFSTYMNGQLLASGVFAGNLNSTSSLKFGHRGNPTDTPGSNDTRGFYLNGLIDEPAVFNRALSTQEIQNIYNLDGSAQGGATIQGNLIGTNAAGTAALGNVGNGITLSNSSGNTIGGTTAAARNVISGNGGAGLEIYQGSNNTVEGNYVGANAAGTAAIGNTYRGVFVYYSSADVIGGTAAGAGNVLAGSLNWEGVGIFNSSNVLVQGNAIGTNAAGTTALGNSGSGVEIENSSSITVGGSLAAARNIIAGNLGIGVRIYSSTSVTAQGNYIGTDISGSVALGNGTGVFMDGGSSGNIIFGDVISGNRGDGVDIYANGNIVEGDYIGTNAAGTAALGNGNDGVFISSAGNTIGGATVAALNVISGNLANGVEISGSSATGNVVQGNYIGTNAAGNAALGNSQYGIYQNSASANSILGNTISGNGLDGININGNSGLVSYYAADGNANDSVGGNNGTFTNPSYTTGISGQAFNFDGATNYVQVPDSLDLSPEATTGEMTVSAWVKTSTYPPNTGQGRTAIVAKGNNPSQWEYALNLWNNGAVQFSVWNPNGYGYAEPAGGTLPLDGKWHLITGTMDVGKFVRIYLDGVLVAQQTASFYGSPAIGPSPMYIGRRGDGEFFNGQVDGVALYNRALSSAEVSGIYASAGASPGGSTGSAGGDTIQGNLIGTNAAGTAALANVGNGISIVNSAGNTVGGTTSGAGNVISGNVNNGVDITGSSATGNVVEGNYIGTNAAGTAALSNGGGIVSTTVQASGGNGISINNAANNIIGGITAAARNVISGNIDNGVAISGSGATGNVVEGNYIGTNAAGTASLAVGSRTPWSAGVMLQYGASNNIIGTNGDGVNDAAEANLISGNIGDGVGILDSGTNNNIVAGNLIGTDYTGNVSVTNGWDGILITFGAQSNRIGANGSDADSTAERNVISGNSYAWGVEIGRGGANSNLVAGNYIGTNLAGTAALANGGGVWIWDGAQSNIVGGTTAAARNIISGNSGGGGVLITGSGTAGNFVQGNYIGTNAAGTAALGNVGYGVSLQSASVNSILNDTISGNSSGGINIGGNGALPGALAWYQADGNANDAILGNNGVLEGGATANGPDVTGGAGNSFSFNGTTSYVQAPNTPLWGYGTNDFSIDLWVNFNSVPSSSIGNPGDVFIGADNGGGAQNKWFFALGGGVLNFHINNTSDVAQFIDKVSFTPTLHQWYNLAITRNANTFTIYVNGVALGSQTDTTPIPTGITAPLTIGQAEGMGYVNGNMDEVAVYGRSLSASEIQNIYTLAGAAQGGATIQGNLIGTDAAGTAALGNAGNGITISNSSGNTIGGAAAGAGNLIANNSGDGVLVSGTDNFVLNNIYQSNVKYALEMSAGGQAYVTGTVAGSVNDNGTIDIYGAALAIGALTGTGVVKNSGALATFTVNGGGSFGGSIEGGNTALTVDGGNQTLMLWGDNTYAGTTTIDTTDVLQIGRGNASATLGSGSVIDNGLLQFDVNNAVTVANSISGTGGLTQAGIGTATLTGSNTYSGTTAINAGMTLQAGSATGLSANSAVNDLGTLNLNGFSSTIGALSGNGTVTNNLVTVYQLDNGQTIQSNGSIYFSNNSSGTEAEDNWVGNVFTATAGATQLNSISFASYQPLSASNLPSPNVTVALYTGSPSTGLTLVPGSVNSVPLNTTGGTATSSTGFTYNLTTVPFATPQTLSAGQVFTAVVLIDDVPGSVFPFLIAQFGNNPSSYYDVSPSGAVNAYNLAHPNAPAIAGDVNVLRVNTATAAPAATLTVTGGGTYSGVIGAGPGSVTINSASMNYLVTTTNDSGAGSLRQAILNADQTTPSSRITFAIPGNGTQTIQPLSALPQITSPVVLDGTSQPGYNGTPLIVLSGANAGSNVSGLVITAGNSTVKGLVINQFSSDGIDLTTHGGDVIEGDYIGTDATGTTAAGNGGSGVVVVTGTNNTIGGTTAAARNIISGNDGSGIILTGGTQGDVIQGNYVGTNVTGTAPLANAGDGIFLVNIATNNTIGGTAAGAGNLVSGNRGNGIEINGYGGPTSGNVIQGNLVGTDATGQIALGNALVGVAVDLSASNNLIGGTAAGAGNVISGNGGFGVRIVDNNTSGNVVQGNLIGTNLGGTAALGNRSDGIAVQVGSPTSPNVIGGTAPGARNVISANAGNGIGLYGSASLVQGDYIGTNAAGTAALGNSGDGVFVSSAGNTIGGTSAGQANIIAYNTGDGVNVSGSQSVGNPIRGNSIYANGGLGINLAGTGNNNQASPAMIAAALDSATQVNNLPAGETEFKATFTGRANTTYQLDIYDNQATFSPNGGQGQTYLGTVTIITDSNGNPVTDGNGNLLLDGSGNPVPAASASSTFFFVLNATPQAGDVLSVTATDPAGNTSQFSNDITTILRPEVSVAGLGLGVRGQVIPYTLTPTVSASDLALGLSYSFNWGDGAYPNGVNYPLVNGQYVDRTPDVQTLTSTLASVVQNHVFTTNQPPNTPYTITTTVQDQYGFTGAIVTNTTQINIFALENNNSEIDVGAQYGGSLFQLTGVLSHSSPSTDTFNLNLDGGASNGGLTINYTDPEFTQAVLASLSQFVLWGQLATGTQSNYFDTSNYVGVEDSHNGPGNNTLVGSATGTNVFNADVHANDNLLIVAPTTANNTLSFSGADQSVTFNLGELSGQAQQVTATGDTVKVTGSLGSGHQMGSGGQTNPTGTPGSISTYYTSNFNDTLYTPGANNLQVFGGTGNDSYVFNPTPGSDPVYSVSNSTFAGGTGNSSFTIAGGSGNNTFTINNSSFTGSNNSTFTVNGGSGNTTFTLANSNTANSSFTIAAAGSNSSFTIGGGTSNGSFTLVNTTGNGTFTLGNVAAANGSFTISGSGTNGTFTMGNVLANNGTFTVGGGSGNSSFTLGNVVTNSTFSVATGAGDSSFTLGNVVNNGSFTLGTGTGNGSFTLGGVTNNGSFTLNTGGGNGSFTLGNVVTNGSFTLGTATSNGSFTVGAGNVTTNGSFTLGTGTGNGTFTLGAISTNGSFTVGTGTGNGSFTMGNVTTNGTFTAGAGTGNASFTIGDINVVNNSSFTMGTGSGNGSFTVNAGNVNSNGSFTLGTGTSSNSSFTLGSVVTNGSFTVGTGTGNGTFTMANVATNGSFTLGTNSGNGTFTVGTTAANGTFTAGSVTTNGSFTMGTGSGNGSFTMGTLTTNGTFTAGTGSGNGSFTIGNINVVNNSSFTMGTGSGNGSFTVNAGNVTSNGSFTLGTGTSSSNSSFTLGNVVTNGSFTVSTGVGNGSFTVSSIGGNGSFTMGTGSGNGTFTVGTTAANGTFTAGSVTTNGSFTMGTGSGNGSFTLGTLTTNGTFTAGTGSGNGSFTIGDINVVNNSSFTMGTGSGNGSFTVNAGNVTSNGSFTLGTGNGNGSFTVSSIGGNGSFTMGTGSGNGTFTVGTTAANGTFTAGAVTTNGSFTMSTGTGNGSFTMGGVSTNGTFVAATTSGNGTFKLGDVSSNGTFVAGAGTVSANGSFTLGTGGSNGSFTMGNLTTNGTFTANTGTGNASFTIGNINVVNNSSFTMGIGSGNGSFTVAAGNVNSNGSFTMGTGTGNGSFTVSSIGGNGSFTMGTGSGNGTFTVGTTAANGTFTAGSVTTNGSFTMGTSSGNGSFTMGNLTTNGTFTAGTGSGNGSFTLGNIVNNGSFTLGTGSGNGSFTVGAGNVTTNGSFTLGTGTSSSNSSFTMGTVTANGTFTAVTGTGNGSFTMGNVSANGSFTVGTSAGNGSFTMGNVSTNGTFTAGTGNGNGTFTLASATTTGNNSSFVLTTGAANGTFNITNGVTSQGSNDTFALNNSGSASGATTLTVNGSFSGSASGNDFFLQDTGTGASNDSIVLNGNIYGGGGSSQLSISAQNAGNDAVTINGGFYGDPTGQNGAGNVYVLINNSGAGNNSFSITGGVQDGGSGNSALVMSNTGQGNDTYYIGKNAAGSAFTGGSGIGYFLINNTGNGNSQYTVDGSVSLGNSAFTFVTLSQQGNGNNNIAVNGPITVGNGNDFFSFGEAGTGTDSISVAGPFTYGSGDVSFEVSGGGEGNKTFNFLGGVHGTGFDTYTFNDHGYNDNLGTLVGGNASFTVNGNFGGGAGNNTFIVTSGLGGSDGTDTFNFNGNLQGGSGPNAFNTFSLTNAGAAFNPFTFHGSLIGGANDAGDDFQLAGNYLGTTGLVSGSGAGADNFQFAGGVQGNFAITAPNQANRTDALDFSTLSQGVNVDISSTSAQQVASGLTLQLSDANGISNVIGSSHNNVIHGNARSNMLAAYDALDSNYTATAPGVGANGKVQVVLLDFDTGPNNFTALINGKQVPVFNFNTYYAQYGVTPIRLYTQAERQAVLQGLQADYAPFLAVFQGTTLVQGGVYFTTSATDAQNVANTYANGKYITEYFNQTPGANTTPDNGIPPPPTVNQNLQPGGVSNDLDFRDADMTGTASIQVNGIVGEPLNPPATEQNWVNLSVYLGAHELGHLLGLHHDDAFGPIGQGIIPLPNGMNYTPPYAGPYDAAETFDHVITSGDATGTDWWNGTRGLFFGEREDVMLAFSFAAPTTPGPQGSLLVQQNASAVNSSTWSAPPSTQPTTLAMPPNTQSLTLASLAVPNTEQYGQDAGKTFEVQAVDVLGNVGLDSTGHSQQDYYSFSGNSGDVINANVMSYGITRYVNQGAAGYFDSVAYLYYQDPTTGQLTQVAFNDDTFSASASGDATLKDIVLPKTGTYVLEVKPFAYAPSDSHPDPSQFTGDDQIHLLDAINNTYTGNYELFVYRFKAGMATSGNDTFTSGAGNATMIGGQGTNTFNLNSSANDTVVGIGSHNTVIGGSSTNNWILTGYDTGTVNNTSFTNVQNLVGGSGNNNFTLQAGSSLAGSILGGGGTNTVIGGSSTNTWNLTGNGTGTLNNTSFSNVQNLVGGSGNNNFTLQPGSSLAGSITGGSGAVNTILVSRDANFTLTNTSLTTSAGDSYSIANIQQANLTMTGTDAHTFDVSGWSGGGQLTGNGYSTLQATKNANFTLTNNSLASSDGMNVSYSGLTTLNVTGSGAANTVNVQSTNGAVTTTVTDGGTINVGSLAPTTGGILDNIAGALIVNGGGTATLVADDIGSSKSKTGTLTSTTLTGLGMGTSGISYSGVTTLKISLGSGGNTFNVISVNSNTFTTVDGGSGTNTANVASAAAFATNLVLTDFAQVSRDVSSHISSSASGLVYNRRTGLFGGTVTLTNSGTTALSGQLMVVFTGLQQYSGVTLANANGTDANGNPYILVNLTTPLQAGQSVTFNVYFRNPNHVLFNYGLTTYDDTTAT